MMRVVTLLPSTDPEVEALAENPEALAQLIAARELEEKKLEWARWANDQYTRCRNARAPFDRQWYLNLAFMAGKQYVVPLDVPSLGFRLTTPNSPPWRVRVVVNKIRPAVITECSKLTSSKPIPTVLPSTNEDEDFAAAKVSEQILKSRFTTSKFEQTYRKFVWWGVVCGNGFLKMYWDPHKKDYESMKMPERPSVGGMPIPDEMLQQVPQLWDKLNQPIPAQGSVCIENVSPFHLYVPDLLSDCIEDQPYIIHVMTKSPLWVQNRYGFKPNVDTRASNTILDAATLITKGAEEHLDAVMVKEVWIKPGGHKDFPEGGILTVINDKVVQHRDSWPYPFPEYPFYKFDGLPTGGFYCDSKLVDLIPLQKEYNKTRSQAIEIKNTMGKPKFLYQKGSVNPKQISSEPGQAIPYVPGYEPPIPLPGVEVPASFSNEMMMLQQEFDDISGQHEISRGQTPNSQLSSGTAIAYLQEQDDAKLTFPIASLENAIEELGKHYLYMVSHYWDEGRLIKATGRNSTFEAINWKKGMLRGNTDTHVDTGSALPFSKAARTSLLMELMQNGFLDAITGLEHMDFGSMDKALDEILIDKQQAMRENLKMAQLPDEMTELLLNPAPGPNGEEGFVDEQSGQQFNGDGTPFHAQPPVPVNSWDDHEQHIQWHNHYRKTQEFEQLSDTKKKAFELHVQMHQFALQASMMNMEGQETVPENEGEEEEELEAEESGDQNFGQAE